jgi:hypothetical protein
MRRINLVLGVLALLTMLVAMTAAPAIADDDIGRDCFPNCDNDRHDHDNGDHNGDDDGDVDVDVEGPFLVDDEVCVFVITEEEENGDEDVDVDEKCVKLLAGSERVELNPQPLPPSVDL